MRPRSCAEMVFAGVPADARRTYLPRCWPSSNRARRPAVRAAMIAPRAIRATVVIPSEVSLALRNEGRAFGLTRGSCERETQRGSRFWNRLYDCQRKGRDSSPPRTARAERGVCVPRMRNAFLLADGFRCLGGRSFSSDIERSGRSPALCAVFLAACAALAVAGSHADLFMFQFNFDL